MVFVTAVILAALITMCVSNYRRYYSDSMRAIEQTLSRNLEDLKPAIDFSKATGKRPQRPEDGGIGRISVFTVILDVTSNTVSAVNDSGIQIDTDTAQTAADAALSSGKASGTIQDMALRFKIEKTDSETKIVFADITYEKDNMQSLLMLSDRKSVV